MREFSDRVLNIALGFATEWGENFRKPILERMRSSCPELSDDEISELETVVQKAEYRVYKIAEMEERGEISETDISRIAAEEFPWMEDRHLGRLKNIGMYYARR